MNKNYRMEGWREESKISFSFPFLLSRDFSCHRNPPRPTLLPNRLPSDFYIDSPKIPTNISIAFDAHVLSTFPIWVRLHGKKTRLALEFRHLVAEHFGLQPGADEHTLDVTHPNDGGKWRVTIPTNYPFTAPTVEGRDENVIVSARDWEWVPQCTLADYVTYWATGVDPIVEQGRLQTRPT